MCALFAEAVGPGHRLRDRELDVEQLAERARYLDEPQRRMIEAVYLQGISAAHLARVRNEEPWRLRYRLRRLVRRLTSRRFTATLQSMHLLSREQAHVAAAHWLRGHTLRQTSIDTGLSLHRVRTLLAEAEGVILADLHRQ